MANSTTELWIVPSDDSRSRGDLLRHRLRSYSFSLSPQERSTPLPCPVLLCFYCALFTTCGTLQTTRSRIQAGFMRPRCYSHCASPNANRAHTVACVICLYKARLVYI